VTADRWAAIGAGAALLVFIVVFFFAKKREVQAESRITVVVDGGYTPDLIVVRRGSPVTLIFDRRDSGPCTDEIVLPDFGIRRPLPTGRRTAITVVPQHVGEFSFSCGMNMLHGRIRATE
jgi:Cu+-exporting ATPase